MRKLILYPFILMTVLVGNVCAQTLQKNVNISKEQSISDSDIKHMKATNTIHFESGFTAKAGCYLHASLVDPYDPANAELLKESNSNMSLSVFPNPSIGIITIRGNFNQDVLKVMDDSGNNVREIIIDGINPLADLSTLKEGTYIIKVLDRSGRLIKK